MGRLDASVAGELIAGIYDCALDPARWPETLSALHRRLGFVNASLGVNALPSGQLLLNAEAGIPPDYALRMRDLGAAVIDLWGGPRTIAALPIDRPQVLSWLRPREAIRASRYYREWAEPQGIEDVVAIGLARDATMVASIGMGRLGSTGPIRADDVEDLALLVPHLQRAMAISRRFDLKEIELASFRSLIDGLATPVAIVDEALVILQLNAAATRALAATGPLFVERDRLTTRDPDLRAALRRAVQASVAARSEAGRDAFVPFGSGDRAAPILHLLPLASDRSRQLGACPCVAVLLAATGTDHDGLAGRAAAAFGLTPAEARIFARIAGGDAIDDICRGLEVERSTVRTHLLRIFSKTGARRQAELATLGRRLSPP